MASDKITQLSSANFDEFITSSASTPVLVDFWAEWCGPCKMIAPVLDEIAEENAGKFLIAKVNVDESGELASKFQVRAIPTLLVFKDGEVVSQIVGMTSKNDLVGKLTAAAG